jgi:hypothetical protein
MAGDEQKVSELAYSIWAREGRPEGESERHWRMAQKAVATLSLAEAAAAMNPDVRARPQESPVTAPTRRKN